MDNEFVEVFQLSDNQQQQEEQH